MLLVILCVLKISDFGWYNLDIYFEQELESLHCPSNRYICACVNVHIIEYCASRGFADLRPIDITTYVSLVWEHQISFGQHLCLHHTWIVGFTPEHTAYLLFYLCLKNYVKSDILCELIRKFTSTLWPSSHETKSRRLRIESDGSCYALFILPWVEVKANRWRQLLS